jgi:hypothetical protein
VVDDGDGFAPCKQGGATEKDGKKNGFHAEFVLLAHIGNSHPYGSLKVRPGSIHWTELALLGSPFATMSRLFALFCCFAILIATTFNGRRRNGVSSERRLEGKPRRT